MFLKDTNGVDSPLDRIESDEGVKSLGVFTQLDGGETDELEYLDGKITIWNTMVKQSPLPPTVNLQPILTRTTRTIIYPLPVTNFTQVECREIEGKLYRHSLPKCGISSKYPFAMRYAPTYYMGLPIPEFYNQHGTQHLFELLKHYNKPTTSGKQMFLQFELARLIVASSKWIFQLKSSRFSQLLDPCWLRTTWDFVLAHNIEMRAPHVQLQTPRVNDSFIMDVLVASDLTKGELVRINHCRIYLQVLTLSDMVDAAGNRILQHYLTGDMTRNRNR